MSASGKLDREPTMPWAGFVVMEIGLGTANCAVRDPVWPNMFCARAAAQVASKTNRTRAGELRIFLTRCLQFRFLPIFTHNRRLVSSSLEPLELLPGKFIIDVSGIQRPRRLEEQHVSLFVGDRTMLYTARNNAELAFF